MPIIGTWQRGQEVATKQDNETEEIPVEEEPLSNITTKFKPEISYKQNQAIKKRQMTLFSNGLTIKFFPQIKCLQTIKLDLKMKITPFQRLI